MAKKLQVEINWKDEPFALVPLTAVDGDKIAAEATRKLNDTLESEKRQRDLIQQKQESK